MLQTRQSRSRFAALVGCAFVAVALAGCGGGGSGASASSASTSSSGTSSVTISGNPATQVQAGQAYSFTPSVTPGGLANLSFSIQNKPAWATFSISSGQLSGTPTSASVGNYANVIISVSNGVAIATLPAFAISVASGSGGAGGSGGSGTGTVTLHWQIPTTNTDGTPLTDLAGYVINYGQNAAALNTSARITTPSTVSYVVDNLSSGIWYFAISAFASDGTQSSLSNIVSTTVQ